MNDYITTHVLLISVEKTDGEKLGFTNHDSDIFYDGVNYRFGTNSDISDIERNLGFSSDSCRLNFEISSEFLSEDDIDRGLYLDAETIISVYDYQAKVLVEEFFRGVISQHQANELSANLEVQDPFRQLDQLTGRSVNRTCDALLGDSRCGLELQTGTHLFEQSILEVNNDIIVVENTSELDAGAFTYGLCFVAGKKYLILADIIHGGTRRLQLHGFSGSTLPAEFVTLQVGCDKSADSCAQKFANIINFQGFPFLPSEELLKIDYD